MNGLKQFIKTLVEPIRVAAFVFRWRNHNPENDTYPVRRFPESKVDVGKGSYGPLNVYFFVNPNEHLYIGKNVSIAAQTSFVLGGQHDMKLLNCALYEKETGESATTTKGHIVVEDDVWIGFGATILSGVTVGKGSVIGARSVLTKSCPPYSVVIGNKFYTYRYSEKIINLVKNIDLDMIEDKELLREILSLRIDDSNYDELLLLTRKLDSSSER